MVVGTVAPLERSNIDTDQIIPSDWLKRIERTGFEKGLFSQWRQDSTFVLNNPKFRNANILLAGANFGIGSSREHAVWALQQYGFEAIISPSFGDIFANNSSKNGLVTIQLPQDQCDRLFKIVGNDPEAELSINIANEQITVPTANLELDFSLDPAVKTRLIEGLDDIAISLAAEDKITAYEANRASWFT